MNLGRKLPSDDGVLYCHSLEKSREVRGSTGFLLQEAKGKASRTAKFGAGGGAAGALIGGIAGGGKEALIGAAAGAGAGAGVAGSGFTGNKDLTIPAESVLQFKLTQPQRLAAGGTHKPKSDSNG